MLIIIPRFMHKNYNCVSVSLMFPLHLGLSGNDRQLQDWSCWLKLETTQRYRECSRLHISTPRVWFPDWIPQQDCIYTGVRPLDHLPSRDPSYPEFYCTMYKDVQKRLCLLCLSPYRDPHLNGEDRCLSLLRRTTVMPPTLTVSSTQPRISPGEKTISATGP